MKKKLYVCSSCGSADVVWDATASWDVDAQDFVVSGVQDQTYCEHCGDEFGDECDVQEVEFNAAPN